MIRGTTQHPKFLILRDLLGASQCMVAGVLELLWHVTATYCPEGNIGKFKDEALAAAIGYDGDPSALIAALVKTGWLDEHPVHRLLVHDWPDHADAETHQELARAGKVFANGAPPRGSRRGGKR